MPMYEYVCPECGEFFSVLAGMDEEIVVECPECSDHSVIVEMERIISQPSEARVRGGTPKHH